MENLKNKEDKEVDPIVEKGIKIKSLLDKLKEALKGNILFLIAICLLTYKGILINSLIGLDVEWKVILYIILASCLIMCPIINNRKKFGYIYFNIIYAIVTLIIFADFVYYSYSSSFLSFYQLVNLQYSNEIVSGLEGILDLKTVLIFWTDNIIALLVSIWAYRKFGKSYYKNKILKAILIVVIILLNILVIITDVDWIYTDKGYNKSLIVQESSIYYYHFEDGKDYFSSLLKKEEIDKERFEEIYNKYNEIETEETEYTGSFENANVIILQLESLNEYIIGKTVNGKEITPNLNKFFSENIYCTDMYNQGLGTTADSEFEMENSLYPLENGYVFQKYYNNTWQDIYTILKEEGYYTSFMHPNTSTFWNREQVYNVGYGIDEYNDILSFSDIESAGEFYSDEGFFEEAVKRMSEYDGKFCTTLVSVTTHIPFYLDGISDLDNKLTLTEEDIEEFEDWIFKNYLLSCNFVDYAFGRFLEELEESGLADNSILIVYGDHGAGLSTISDIQKLYEENGLEYTEFENITKDVHIPFGIRTPGEGINETITRVVSKIDIKPTIMDLLGVEDGFSIGKNIFSDKDYSFIKGLGFITSNYYCINDIYYDRELLEEIEETEELSKLLEQMEDEIYLSDTIIKNNILRDDFNFEF